MMYLAKDPLVMSSTAGSSRILLCEDDAVIAMHFQAVLETSGYVVVGPVCTGTEALVEADRHPPDLALVDIGLRGAIDGISVAAELASRAVPVIFLTGDYQRACLDGREFAADILIKPVSDGAILKAVASVLTSEQQC